MAEKTSWKVWLLKLDHGKYSGVTYNSKQEIAFLYGEEKAEKDSVEAILTLIEPKSKDR